MLTVINFLHDIHEIVCGKVTGQGCVVNGETVPSLCLCKIKVCSYHRFPSVRRSRSTVLDHVHKATVVVHLLLSDNDISCDERRVLVD